MEIATVVPPRTATRTKHYTPFCLFAAKGKERQPDVEILEALKVYNQELGSRPFCINRKRSNTEVMTCNCLNVLSNDEYGADFCAAVAEYQFNFCSMSRTGQYKIFIEFIRGRNEFPLPFIVNEEDAFQEKYKLLRELSICNGALMDIFGFGKDRWKLAVKAANNNFIPGHKLTGRPSNNKKKFDGLFGELLALHFAELRKEAGPIATRFVREETGELTVRDNNDQTEYLDASLSKRACYRRFCKELGVETTTDSVGRDHAMAVTDGDEIRIPSWFAYRQYWNTHHPHLRVSRPAEDICSYCFAFHNQHKYKSALRNPNLFLPVHTNKQTRIINKQKFTVYTTLK